MPNPNVPLYADVMVMPVEEVVNGFGRVMAVTVFADPKCVCIMCFDFIGKHYHMPLAVPKGMNMNQMIGEIVTNTEGAFAMAVHQWKQLPREKRELFCIKEN